MELSFCKDSTSSIQKFLIFKTEVCTVRFHTGHIKSLLQRSVCSFCNRSSPLMHRNLTQKTCDRKYQLLLLGLTEKSLEQVALENPHHSLNGSFELLLLRFPQFSAVLLQKPQSPSCVCRGGADNIWIFVIY